MILFLRKLGNCVRQGQRLRKVVDRKDASQALDPVELDDVPIRNLRLQLGDLLIRHGRGILATRDALQLRQCLHLAGWTGAAAHRSLKRAASSEPPVASPALYECAPAPASMPRSTIRYSSRIGRSSNQHSSTSRVPAAERACADSHDPEICGVIPW